jgi:hypothetical protein
MIMSYVITCGDEGVQINEGTRLGVIGAGFQVEHFPDIVKALKKVVGKEIAIVSNQENDWIKAQLDLSTWDQVDASSQQHIQALADKEGLLYAGYLPFADPKQLQHGVKGHMVRPHKIHIANKICFTLAGGEQVYNLGRYMISADWVAEAPKDIVKSVLQTQIDFYTQLNKGEALEVVVEEAGVLGEAVAEKNKKVLQALGFIQ